MIEELKCFLVNSCQMVVEGNFVSEDLWTLRTAITSGNNVLCIDMALHIVTLIGQIATLKTLISNTIHLCHQRFYSSCKNK